MKKINKIKKILSNPYYLCDGIWRRLSHFIKSDELYIRVLYYLKKRGKVLDLHHPQTFNEKLQWLKLYGFKPEYSMMVDKAAVKKYIRECVGDKYVIPTYAVWERVEDIDWNKLPNKFVLKNTIGSGGYDVVVCKDKSKLNKKEAIQKLSATFDNHAFWFGREQPYKGLKPRIIAEELLEDKTGNLKDYKFFCFNGEPKFLYISEDLDNHDTAKISFLNTDWTFAPFRRSDFAPFTSLPERPANYGEMIEVARKLSTGIPHVRVDLYDVEGKIYFGELTFFTCSGFIPFVPDEWDYKIGEWLKLPTDK